MPDFAPNVTARYKLHYRVVGRTHTMLARGVRDIDASTLQADCSAYLRSVFSTLASILADDLTFISAEYALTDSDLFFPATVPAAVVGGAAIATLSKQDSASHLTFSGRGAKGSKTNVKVYGASLGPDALPANLASDFVLLSSELAAIANCVAALNASPGGRIVAIDNSVATYYARATLKVNDFWLKRVRQGL